ncbi:hypothetical protein [Dactylosporangium salmoneum]|uniref:Uncharacterized protein n=1 Tax=Dactylosporangium salmoneum TaxID=53361 RepID=A0ABN3FDS3_9ACTN
MSWLKGERIKGTEAKAQADQVASLTTAGWTSYAPAWTASSGTQPSLGNGSLTGRWRRPANADLVHVQIKLVPGSSTTFGGNIEWIFSLPIPAHANDLLMGNGFAQDTGTFYRPVTTKKATTSTFFVVSGVGGVGLVHATAPHTWASTDELNLQLTYQPA